MESKREEDGCTESLISHDDDSFLDQVSKRDSKRRWRLLQGACVVLALSNIALVSMLFLQSRRTASKAAAGSLTDFYFGTSKCWDVKKNGLHCSDTHTSSQQGYPLGGAASVRRYSAQGLLQRKGSRRNLCLGIHISQFVQWPPHINKHTDTLTGGWVEIEPTPDHSLSGGAPLSHWGDPAEEWQEGSQVWATTLMHQIHCLGMMKSTWTKMANGESINNRRHDHFPHCIEYLRQAVMCQADLTLEPAIDPMQWPIGTSGWGVVHECKDWDAVLNAVKQRAVLRGNMTWSRLIPRE